MELQELRTFVAVTEHKSFSKAAVYLEYSQAAVTVQIKNLEEELSVRLFDRLGKTIRLTSSGRILYEHAIRVLNDVSQLMEAVSESDTITGNLRIGTIDSLCSSVFPNLADRFHEKCPKVSLSITTDTPSKLLTMLKNNELDMLYLFDEIINDPVLINAYVSEERIVFAAAADHLLADGRMHDINELLEYPFILTEKAASYRRVLDTKLLKEGKEIIPVFECNNTDILIDQLIKKKGIAFLPYYATKEFEKQKIIRQIKVHDYNINIWHQVLYHKNKWVNKPMKDFLELLS